MFRRSVFSMSATVAGAAILSAVLAAMPSSAYPAEISLLGPVSFRALFPKLLRQFETSSGNKVTDAYAPLGVIVTGGEKARISGASVPERGRFLDDG